MSNPFSKDYVPVFEHDKRELQRREAVRRSRVAATTTGSGWGGGTLPMKGTPKRLPPGKIEKA